MKPNISVIIPFFNRAATVFRAIDSVLQQEYSDFELILVDDGSTDTAAEQIEQRYGQQLLLLRQENRGVSAARNYGVQASQGEWIAFLDSDDHWHPSKLQSQINYLEKHPAIRICQTEEIWIRNGKRVNAHKKHKKPSGWIFEESLMFCTVSPSSTLLSRQLFEESGGFDEALMACEDYDLWLRITCRNPVALLPELLLNKTGGHADQLSGKFPVMDCFRIYSILKVLSNGCLSPHQEEQTLAILNHKLEVMRKGAQKRGKDIRDILQITDKIKSERNFLDHQQLLQEVLLQREWI